ncbi:MAG: AIR synthase-related protein [Candidatus Micrarchaeia archaeon]
MPSRIEIGFLPGTTDARGKSARGRIRSDLGIEIGNVRTIDVYTFSSDFPRESLSRIAEGALLDPIVQAYSISLADSLSPLAMSQAYNAGGFSWAIEVGFLPGVTDNVGNTAREAVTDLLGESGFSAHHSVQYLFYGELSQEQAKKIAESYLSNSLIESYSIKSGEEFLASKGFQPYAPIVKLAHSPQVSEFNIRRGIPALLADSDKMVLALSGKELAAIKKYFSSPGTVQARQQAGLGINPTDVEIEMLAQTWSEHCKHKIFNARIRYTGADGKTRIINSLFKSYIRKATEKIMKRAGRYVSVFKDNAGIFSFTQDYNIAVKVETHNAPSALDPYGGALTGIVGVNRDVLGAGMGARFIFNTDVFCFASPYYSGKLPPKVLHPKRIFEGVRKGVEHGGNTTGVPTVNGSIVFEDRFLGRPLVYCGTGGIMPAVVNGKPSHVKEVAAGDVAVMVGGRVGKDGIHGATFSSMEIHEGSPATAVQIGDPITQRKMYDMLLFARDKGLYRAITDNGAGGLSSSIGEMSQMSGGCVVNLDKVPLKYPGLDPWEILVSESQERMTVAVPKEKLSEFLGLAKQMEVEATPVGEFTSSGYFIAMWGERQVANLEMGFLHDGVPQMRLEAKALPAQQGAPSQPTAAPEPLGKALHAMLGRLNICSKEYVVRQYDHEVQGTSVVKPLEGAANDGPSDAAVQMPVPGIKKGIVVSNGICPKYSDYGAYGMSACAFDEAVRNAVATGADPKTLAMLDNFCWPDPIQSEKTPDGEYKLGALVDACRALYDFSIAYKAPMISGKDSMKNDFKSPEGKISIPPTLLYTCVAEIPDVARACTMDAKAAGDIVYVLGMTGKELAGSEYYSHLGIKGGKAPAPDAKTFYKMYCKLHKAIMSGFVRSCHDCSDGGMAVALAETAFAGGFGASIDISKIPCEQGMKNDEILFSESQGRFIITVREKDTARLEKKLAGFPLARVGAISEEPVFKVSDSSGAAIIEENVNSLKESWKKTLAW